MNHIQPAIKRKLLAEQLRRGNPTSVGGERMLLKENAYGVKQDTMETIPRRGSLSIDYHDTCLLFSARRFLLIIIMECETNFDFQ